MNWNCLRPGLICKLAGELTRPHHIPTDAYRVPGIDSIGSQSFHPKGAWNGRRGEDILEQESGVHANEAGERTIDLEGEPMQCKLAIRDPLSGAQRSTATSFIIFSVSFIVNMEGAFELCRWGRSCMIKFLPRLGRLG